MSPAWKSSKQRPKGRSYVAMAKKARARPGLRPAACPEQLRGRGAVALEQATGDHHPLDLVGALTDHHERRVPVVPLDRKVGRVAVAAVNAHGLGGVLERRLRGEELGHPGL